LQCMIREIRATTPAYHRLYIVVQQGSCP
jgi:hypothetical protein